MNYRAFEPGYKLINEDCLVGMKSIADRSVDIVVTSPPYNLGLNYSKYDDNGSRKDYLDWCSEWGQLVFDKLQQNGSLFLNVGAAPSNPLLPHQIALQFSEIFCLQNTFHWIKSISLELDGETISSGHFKPINSKRFITDCHEYIFHFTRSGNTELNRLNIGVPYQDKSNIRRWKHTEGRDKRCRGNNWFIPYKTIMSRDKDRPHPATFPPQLAQNCILLHGVTDTTVVLDPFLGLGHSAIAAIESGVQYFIGFEIDAGYLEIALQSVSSRRHTTSKPKSVEQAQFQPNLF